MEKEVCFNKKKLVKIDKQMIEEIKKRAKLNANGKYRFCLQHSAEDSLHEMYIVRSRGDYGRPDKHLYTTESHTIVEGKMLVILFENDGRIKELFELSKDCYYTYRIDTNIYHMQVPISEQVVYLETKLGPFNEKSNIFPDWAPEPSESEKVKMFMDELEKKIQIFCMQNSEGV